MSISCQGWSKLSVSCEVTDKSENLQQFAVGRSQGDQGHLAGQARDLLHQQGHLGCPGLPVLHLHLGPEVVPLYPQLLTLNQKILDGLHPLLEVSLKPNNIIFLDTLSPYLAS